MRKKWNVQNRKGYLKIHQAVDVKSKKILSVKVIDEHKHDSKVLPELIEGIAKQNCKEIAKLLADGAYDSNTIFQLLANRGILPSMHKGKEERIQR